MGRDKFKINRRGFLGKSIVGFGGIAFFSAIPKAYGGTVNEKKAVATRLYGSESGVYALDGQPYFVLGGLQVGNYAAHEDAINQLRTDLSYRTELTYKSNDKFKEEFARELIDYFVQNMGSDLSFGATIISNPTQVSGSVPPGTSRANNPSSRYRINERLMIYEGVLRGISVSQVVVKNQTPFGPSTSFNAEFESITGKELITEEARFNQLLQLSDFFTGCVAGEINRTRSPLKLRLIDHLKARLGINALAGAYLNAFQVIQP